MISFNIKLINIIVSRNKNLIRTPKTAQIERNVENFDGYSSFLKVGVGV